MQQGKPLIDVYPIRLLTQNLAQAIQLNETKTVVSGKAWHQSCFDDMKSGQ